MKKKKIQQNDDALLGFKIELYSTTAALYIEFYQACFRTHVPVKQVMKQMFVFLQSMLCT